MQILKSFFILERYEKKYTMHSKHDVEPNVDYNETLNAKENIQSIFENDAVGNMGEELCKKYVRTDDPYE